MTDLSEVVSQRAALISLVQDFAVTLERQIVSATTLPEIEELGKRVEQLYPLLTSRTVGA